MGFCISYNPDLINRCLLPLHDTHLIINRIIFNIDFHGIKVKEQIALVEIKVVQSLIIVK